MSKKTNLLLKLFFILALYSALLTTFSGCENTDTPVGETIENSPVPANTPEGETNTTSEEDVTEDTGKSGPPPPTTLPSANFPSVPSANRDNANKYTSFIQKVQDNMELGQIAFRTPEKMKLNETETVTIRISADLKENITEDIPDSTVEEMKVSDFLSATLEGTGFEIDPKDLQTQALPRQVGRVQWRWNITPKKTGRQELELSVYARVKFPDQPEENIFIETFTKEIEVEVDSLAWWGQLRKWITENGAVVVTAFLTAVGTTIGTTIATRQNSKKN